MKKIFALMLALAVSAFCFAACGDDTAKDTADTSAASGEVVEDSAAEVVEDSAADSAADSAVEE